MGIASMVIGIVAAILGFVPFCNYFAFIPAIVGLALGIVDVVLRSKKGEQKGIGIAGIVLNGAAIILIFLWTVVFAGAAATVTKELEKAVQSGDKQVEEMKDRLEELKEMKEKNK